MSRRHNCCEYCTAKRGRRDDPAERLWTTRETGHEQIRKTVVLDAIGLAGAQQLVQPVTIFSHLTSSEMPFINCNIAAINAQ
jgi:hypothetical protein